MALRIFSQRKSGLWDPLGHETGTGGKLFNGIRVALPGALSPYLAPLGLVLGFPQATGACFSATRFTRRLGAWNYIFSNFFGALFLPRVCFFTRLSPVCGWKCPFKKHRGTTVFYPVFTCVIAFMSITHVILPHRSNMTSMAGLGSFDKKSTPAVTIPIATAFKFCIGHRKNGLLNR